MQDVRSVDKLFNKLKYPNGMFVEGDPFNQLKELKDSGKVLHVLVDIYEHVMVLYVDPVIYAEWPIANCGYYTSAMAHSTIYVATDRILIYDKENNIADKCYKIFNEYLLGVELREIHMVLLCDVRIKDDIQ